MLILNIVDKIVFVDRQLFVFLNGLHSDFTDFIFYWLSNPFVWIPLYLWMIYQMYRFYGKKLWYILGFVALMMIASENLTNLVKYSVERLRPCHDETLTALIHTGLASCGGKYGFYSAHCSNHFAIAIFTFSLFRSKIRYFAPLIIIWAASIAYSRIALGAHFPLDVLCGSLAGILIGIIFYRITQKYLKLQIEQYNREV